MSIQVKDANGVTQTINSLPSLGQATSANSLPVVLASDQSALSVSWSGQNVAATQSGAWSVSLSGTPPVSVSGSVAVTGTFWQATQPVSLASLPALAAGSAIIGKTGIDQTTPGTTNGVVVNALPSSTVEVDVTPTVTAASYAANKVIGGIMTFTGVLPAGASYAAMLELIKISFKGSVQTAGFYVGVFTASPTGTFTDASTAAIASGDSASLVGVYHLTTANSPFGTHTIYNLDGIAKAINGSSANLYVVVVPDATTAALGSTSDMMVGLGVI